jgi:hypothetical protein
MEKPKIALGKENTHNSVVKHSAKFGTWQRNLPGGFSLQSLADEVFAESH